MSGIIGLIAQQPANQSIYDALLLLQHRGQHAAGITTVLNGKFFVHKSRGLVLDVFHTRHMRALPGNSGIGQVSYPPADMEHKEEEVQPFYANSPFGISLVQDGRLSNASALAQELLQTDRYHINTESHAEIMLAVLARELEKATTGSRIGVQQIFQAVAAVHQRVRGAYAVIAHIAGYGMLAFRDPNGIRPLSLGRNPDGAWMIASESVALQGTNHHTLERSVAPGEAVFVTLEGQLHQQLCGSGHHLYPCLFEYIYLARPDSTLDGISVYQARLALGEALAQRVVSVLPPSAIDVVIPIPESSRPSANRLASLLDRPYREGLVKNRYIGRTFIMPGQAVRKKSVRQKLNTISSEFAGRNVLLVDDSIVRGTTSTEIVQMARQAGAHKVYLASAAPPVLYPNIYGIDMPTHEELICHLHTPDQVRQIIGADALIFQDLKTIKKNLLHLNPKLDGFEASCFDGYYMAGKPANLA